MKTSGVKNITAKLESCSLESSYYIHNNGRRDCSPSRVVVHGQVSASACSFLLLDDEPPFLHMPATHFSSISNRREIPMLHWDVISVIEAKSKQGLLVTVPHPHLDFTVPPDVRHRTAIISPDALHAHGLPLAG